MSTSPPHHHTSWRTPGCMVLGRLTSRARVLRRPVLCWCALLLLSLLRGGRLVMTSGGPRRCRLVVVVRLWCFRLSLFGLVVRRRALRCFFCGFHVLLCWFCFLFPSLFVPACAACSACLLLSVVALDLLFVFNTFNDPSFVVAGLVGLCLDFLLLSELNAS